MELGQYVGIASYGLQTAMLVSAPVLVLALIAGVTMSIIQAATQINDSALAFIPKILATVVALAIFGPWMMSKMAAFATFAFNQIPMVTN